MKVLFVAPKHDYGDPQRGRSFEFHNFLPPLAVMSEDCLFLDSGNARTQGRRPFADHLRTIVADYHPDLLFTLLGSDELDPGVLRWIRDETETTTINWFADDHWRFDSFSRHWAPLFDWSVTTDPHSLAKYSTLGAKAMLSQWGCNPLSYRNLDLPTMHDVTFVGQSHGTRKADLTELQRQGIDVKAWGHGWSRGRLSQGEMVRVFNQSRINLNLANSSSPANPSWLHRVARVAGHGVPRWLVPQETRERVATRLGQRATKQAPAANRQQIKGRNFEVPACGGFMLTERVERLAEFYVPGKEVVCYDDMSEVPGLVRHFLDADEERRIIAEAGHARTLREHTYFHRFVEIFRRAGLKTPGIGGLLGKTDADVKFLEV